MLLSTALIIFSFICCMIVKCAPVHAPTLSNLHLSFLNLADLIPHTWLQERAERRPIRRELCSPDLYRNQTFLLWGVFASHSHTSSITCMNNLAKGTEHFSQQKNIKHCNFSMLFWEVHKDKNVLISSPRWCYRQIFLQRHCTCA